jgi:TonB family protein
MRLSSILGCAALAPLLVGASEPVRLQPSSGWVLDYADDSCRLIRMFGQGDDETKLVIESVAPGNLTMVAVGKRVRAALDDTKVSARFLPVQQNGFLGTAQRSEDNQAAVLWTSVPLVANIELDEKKMPEELRKAVALARSGVRPAAQDAAKREVLQAAQETLEAETTALEIKPSGRTPVVLETGSLKEPMKMFEQCDRDLLHDIGLDPNVQDRIVRPAWAPKPSSWFSPSIYPRSALFRGQQVSVLIRLVVDASGRVTKCTSLSQFDAPEFKKAVCDAALKYGTFEPAELADGTKVANYFVERIEFRIAGPDDPPVH